MTKTPASLALIVAVPLCSAILVAQGALTATTPRPGGNAEAAKVQNPVPATPESVAEGRVIYRRTCSRCHGIEGRGDGGGAGAGGQPADFTDDVWEFGSSDGEIFYAIHDGTSADMQSYADLLPDTDIWNVVNFLRSLGPEP